MVETHVELAGSNRAPPRNAVRIRDVNPHAHIEVTVTVKGPALPDEIPRQALSRAQIDERWGPSRETVDTVERVLRSYGLHVNEVTQGGRSLHVAGSAAAIAEAFRPNLGIYRVLGLGEIRGREGKLWIPKQLDGLITGIDGLDQRQMARRHGGAAVLTATSALKPLTPADLEARYGFPAGDAAGQTVAIAEFGAPLANGEVLPPAYIPSDVADFCAAHGLPAAKIRIEAVNIAPLNQSQFVAYMHQLSGDAANELFGATAETMMDVQIVAALCPGADVAVYFASWDQKGWIDLLDQLTSGHPATPVAISISYGLAEEAADWSQGAMTSINHRLQIAAMMGITVCVSSGDDGTSCQLGGSRAHVAFPGSSPFVLSVGGTMLVESGGVVDEVVWWEPPGRRTPNGGGATGGGVSALNPRPAWQTVAVGSLNRTSFDGRVVPDVAALAGPPLYDLLLNGQPFPDGGTSASAPLWASLIARLNALLPAAKRQRFLPPLIYVDAVAKAGFRDIVDGHNASQPHPGKGYAAGRGFDAVTGWGAPQGEHLLAALQTV
jgi:kumamolisin